MYHLLLILLSAAVWDASGVPTGDAVADIASLQAALGHGPGMFVEKNLDILNFRTATCAANHNRGDKMPCEGFFGLFETAPGSEIMPFAPNSTNVTVSRQALRSLLLGLRSSTLLSALCGTVGSYDNATRLFYSLRYGGPGKTRDIRTSVLLDRYPGAREVIDFAFAWKHESFCDITYF